MQKKRLVAVAAILVIAGVLAAARLAAAYLPNFMGLLRGLHGG